MNKEEFERKAVLVLNKNKYAYAWFSFDVDFEGIELNVYIKFSSFDFTDDYVDLFIETDDGLTHLSKIDLIFIQDVIPNVADWGTAHFYL
jgi:hypothetical protein